MDINAISQSSSSIATEANQQTNTEDLNNSNYLLLLNTQLQELIDSDNSNQYDPNNPPPEHNQGNSTDTQTSTLKQKFNSVSSQLGFWNTAHA